MRYGILADVHLTRYGQDPVDQQSNLPERLHSIKEVLYSVGDYSYENDLDGIILAGDLIHTKSLLYTIAQNLIIDYIEQYEDMDFYILDGNHDLSGKGKGAISSLRFLYGRENVEFISQHPFQDGNVLMVPYSYDIVNQVKKHSADVLISHFGLSEGVLNSGISIVSDISLRDLVGKYKVAILGHYHKPQEIIRDDIRLYYVGSPIQLDWGEKGDVKRFLVLDTETLEVQSIPTTGYRQHIELEINNSNKMNVLQKAESFQKEGHHIKLVKTENVSISSDNFRVVDRTEKDITNRGINSSMSMEDKHKQYLSVKEIPEDEYDEYMKAALEIIHECEDL